MTPLSFLLLLPLHASAPATAPAAAAAAAGSSPSPATIPATTEARPILSLDAAEQNALRNQPLLREARAATDASVGRIEQSRSGYLPQVTGTATVEQATNNLQFRPGVTVNSGATPVTGTLNGTPFTATIPSSPIPGVSWNPSSNYWQFNVTATQLIYDFGQTREKWRASEKATDSLTATERTTQHTILLNVRTAYFTARADKALVKVAFDTLSNQQKHMAQVVGFVGAGTNPEIDLATARTAVANARVALITAQNNYDTARAQLNLAIGVNASTNYDVADEGLKPVDGEDQSPEVLFPTAIKNRPELRSLTLQRESLELTVKSLKGQYGPSIAAVANLSEVGLVGSGDSIRPNWYVGGSLTWPFISGGLTQGQVHEAQANVHNEQAQIEAEQLQVHLDIEQALLAVRAAKASIDAAEEAVTNARLQLKLAEGRYAQGVGSIIELDDAQVAMTSAAAQAVQADYNLATARAQLLTALGRP